MSRRAAHCVHSVTVPPARIAASRSSSGAACGSSNSAARPGSANHADSPVSHSDTSTPAATAVAATVNACEQRSGASGSGGDLDDEATGHAPQHKIVGVVTEIGFVSLLVAGFGALAGGLIYRRGSSLEGAFMTENSLQPPPWLNAPPVEPSPFEDTHDLRAGPDLHPALLGLLPYVGVWRGRGVGGYPTIEDFHFAQEIRISHDGRPFLRVRVACVADRGGRHADPAVVRVRSAGSGR